MTSTGDREGVLPVKNETDITRARQFVRQLCQQIKLSLVDQTKLITAASELTRNTLVYGGGGVMEWQLVNDGFKDGVRLAFVDEGPGIPDLDLALKDGWTSGNGMGLGLSGSKRLVHDFSIDTAPGKGTRVTITRWK
ncbi:MAG: anti-sigma regulatory factor [Rubrivivax sp.]|nr:MAG: anti-sigma regulatory factor [Rubrivivax sp.]